MTWAEFIQEAEDKMTAAGISNPRTVKIDHIDVELSEGGSEVFVEIGSDGKVVIDN